MTSAQIDFATYCIGNLSERLGLPLIQSGIADLHCRSDEYLAEEIFAEYAAGDGR